MQTENREGRLSKTGFFEDPYGVVQKVSEGKKDAEVHLSLRT